MAVVSLTAVYVAGSVPAAVTQNIEPANIGLGEAAQLTIAASGSDASSIAPPMVPGLEFVAVGQSQRIESINGATRATTSVTYQVIPHRAGVFTIPGETAGSSPLELTVASGADNASGIAAVPNPASGAPQTSRSGQSGAAAQSGANGSAFVRMRLAKQDLYVGETVPVDIQVGTRDGMVASLNGQPTLNGDAFTLDKLSAQPQRTAEVIDGKPFTVFTWHSALAAVKPGHLSLTMETPLTVRIRSTARADSRFFGGSGFDDLLNDPALQSFFGTSVEKAVTVTSSPATFNVEALPTEGRPANFSGAIGNFKVSSDVSEDRTAAGDPITLHMHVSGRGNFDRVSSPMLHDVEHWKFYTPTSTFKAQDQIGYSGEKTFDQPVIATQPGVQSLPALAFSWFDPVSQRYDEAHTAALSVAVSPNNPAETSASRTSAAQTSPPAALASPGSDDSLRPDHAVTGSSVASPVPHYFAMSYIVAPSVLALAFLGAGVWIRTRERRAHDSQAAHDREAALETAPLLTSMDQAAGNGNAELFFNAARQAVQRALALRWNVATANVTSDEAEKRLGDRTEVAELFELADEAAYSKLRLTAIDVKRWKRVVLQQINPERAS